MVDFQTNVTVLISVDGCYDLQFLCMLCNSYAMVPMYIIYIYIRLALWHNWVVNLLVLHELCSIHTTHMHRILIHTRTRINYGNYLNIVVVLFIFFSSLQFVVAMNVLITNHQCYVWILSGVCVYKIAK